MLCATSPEILSSNTEIGLRWLLLPNAKVKWLSASYWSIRNAYIQFIEFPTSPIYIYPFCLELMSDRKNGCLRGNQPLIIELRFDSAPSDGMLDLVLCLQSE